MLLNDIFLYSPISLLSLFHMLQCPGIFMLCFALNSYHTCLPNVHPMTLKRHTSLTCTRLDNQQYIIGWGKNSKTVCLWRRQEQNYLVIEDGAHEVWTISPPPLPAICLYFCRNILENICLYYKFTLILWHLNTISFRLSLLIS